MVSAFVVNLMGLCFGFTMYAADVWWMDGWMWVQVSRQAFSGCDCFFLQ